LDESSFTFALLKPFKFIFKDPLDNICGPTLFTVSGAVLIPLPNVSTATTPHTILDNLSAVFYDRAVGHARFQILSHEIDHIFPLITSGFW
jgi:hypothetical protein